jgi:hypothetical protein
LVADAEVSDSKTDKDHTHVVFLGRIRNILAERVGTPSGRQTRFLAWARITTAAQLKSDVRAVRRKSNWMYTVVIMGP